MSTYAELVEAGQWATLWVCTDCLLTHANGEHSPDRPESLPEPLSLIDGAHDDLSMGLRVEGHADTCTPQDREERCDCETIPFGWLDCEGCGDTNAGKRHAMFLVFGVRQ